MNDFEIQAFCEKIIKPYKEQLSEEALAEIKSIYEDYCFDDDPNVVYTDEELEKIKDVERFELVDMVCYVLDKNGFPVYDDLGIEGTDIL